MVGKKLFFVMGVFLLCWSILNSYEVEKTATIIETHGYFSQVDLKGDGNLVDCEKGMVLTDKSVIVTGLESYVVIAYGNKGKMKIGEMSNVKLSKVLYTKDSLKCRADLKVGEVEVKVDPKLSEVDFSVATPTSTASVRGTHEKVAYHPGFGTKVWVFRGKVFTQGKKGMGFHVTEGEQTSIDEDEQQPTPVYEETYEEYKEDYVVEGRTEEEEEAIADATTPVAETPQETQQQESSTETATSPTSVSIRGTLEGGTGVLSGSGSVTIGW